MNNGDLTKALKRLAWIQGRIVALFGLRMRIDTLRRVGIDNKADELEREFVRKVEGLEADTEGRS